MPNQSVPSECLVCELKHGARLAIWNIEGKPKISEVAGFLADAVKYFKHQRDELKKETYTAGPFGQTIGRPSSLRAELQLSCVHDALPTALWVEAVIDAFCRIESLAQMANRPSAMERENAAQPDPHFSEALRLLRLPDCAHHAIFPMMRRGLTDSEIAACHRGQPPDYKKTRIRAHSHGYFVSVGDVNCYVSEKLLRQLTGIGRFSHLPTQTLGIGCDATLFVFGSLPQYVFTDIPPESRDLAFRFIDHFPQLPDDAKPYPVIVDISDSGEFITTVSKTKRIKGA